ncbi:MAG: hypothetical protein A3A16_01995 [Candidatus Harrisonbacteria bacterium RIFCSPLOWO2_01_FULL_44_18]|uniref:PI3K/PI4K catalytic domain-containing protein n=1 Tax=Candidatus Harrisonbacteria bacterium RIFCSPLOWO2_01_FULL_44_18 TaxID=1798407 RepID=A0A1G1ZL83_9BACT|nr:MAG: hypothetical protein A3A16_01995 [Candidatus Harrisonbacteria bacterium RIFCSPLOWO2_01_FULL_44_18]
MRGAVAKTLGSIPSAPTNFKKAMENNFEKKAIQSGDAKSDSAMAEFLNPTIQERILETREIENSEVISGGANRCVLVKLKDDGSGIFKPASGEGENHIGKNFGQQEVRLEVRAGTYYKRERATYLVDRFLDFNLVPPTVIREIDGEIGSLQQIVDYDNFGFEVPWHKLPEKELMKLFALDYILWSSDRGPENLLIKNNRIYAIDNGLTFGPDKFLPFEREGVSLGGDSEKSYSPPPPEIYSHWSIPAEIKEKINTFLERGRWQILRGQLLELLPPDEVDACFARIQKFAELIKNKGEISSRAELQFNPAAGEQDSN